MAKDFTEFQPYRQAQIHKKNDGFFFNLTLPILYNFLELLFTRCACIYFVLFFIFPYNEFLLIIKNL